MMSSHIMGKDGPDDGNRPSNSGTSDKTLQLNKIIVNQKGLCVLDGGKQQLQNLQGCSIFILSPTQLKNLGLVAKMKNGKPVIMNESKGGGTTESIAEPLSINQLVPLLESKNVSPDPVALDRANVTNSEGHVEVMEVSAKSHSLKESAIVDENKEKSVQYVKMSGGVKRKRLGETTGNKQKQPQLLKSKDTSEDGSVMSIGDKDISVVSGDSVPKSMQLWRYETQRHLPRFAVHWQLALAEIGYINCPMMECNYISLSEADMFNHYLHCDGKSSIAINTCPICMCRLGTENDLKTHMLRSHPGDGFHRKTLQQVMIKNKWEVRPKVKLLAKRRSFCKVHRVSWNIAIESKGYVKCLFQNCTYLAITVDEMIKHYGICNGGGDIGGYPYPYKCPHCGGCVETEEKLQTHIEKSHTTGQSSYQTKLLPGSSKTVKQEEVLSTRELMKPIKLETKENKGSSYCQDSFIITLNAPDGNDTDDKHIQLVSVDKIKTELSTADGYEDDTSVQNMYPSDTGELRHYTRSFPVTNVKSCPSSEMLPVYQVLTWGDNTAPKELSVAQKEQKVAKVIGVKEIYCQKKEKADDIVIERVGKSRDSETTDRGNIPDVSIQLVPPALFTARTESGTVNSEQSSDGSTCTMEKPVDYVSTEMDLKQHTYVENHLFSSDLSSSEQSDDIDVKPDIIENDTVSYLNMHHVRQYSSIYSDDSYKGKFYRKVKSEANCNADTLGARVSERFDGCKNTEHQSVNDDRGIASRSVLKTYSRRALRAHSNTTASRFSSKSVKEVTCLKKEESDVNARRLNEPVDQCDGQGTFRDSCSDNDITRSCLRDAGSTGLFSIVDKQCKVDSDVGAEIKTPQNAQKSRSSSRVALVPEGISELVSSAECVNNMETIVSAMKSTGVLQSGTKIDASAIVTLGVPKGRSEHHVNLEGVDAMETDVSTVVDTGVLHSGRRRDSNSIGTDCIPEGSSEHCVSSECVDIMETDVSTIKDTEVLQSERRRGRPSRRTAHVPGGNSEQSGSSECVDAMEIEPSTSKDAGLLQSGMRRDTDSVGTDCVPERSSEHCVSSECVGAVETDVSIVKDTEVVQSGRARDTNSVGTDCIPEKSSEHCVSSERVDNLETDVSSVKDTEVMQSGRMRDTNSVGTDCVPKGISEHCVISECVDAMETDVSTVKDSEVLQSRRWSDTSSVGPDSVPEGNSEHIVSAECVDDTQMDVSAVKDTGVVQSGRKRDTNSVGTDCVHEGISEHYVSSECVDAMETDVSTVNNTDVLQSGRVRDAFAIGTDCVPEGISGQCCSSEGVDAMEMDVSTVKDTEVLQPTERRATSSFGPDNVPKGESKQTVSSECVDAVETDVSTVKNAEVLLSGTRRDTISVGTDCVHEGNSEHCHSSECEDTIEMDVSTVKDTEVLQSGRMRDTSSVGTDFIPEGNSEHCISSESMDAMGARVNTVKDSEVLQSGGRRDTSSIGLHSVPEGNSEHAVSTECVDAMEMDVGTVKDTEVLQSGRMRVTGTVGTDCLPEGDLEHCVSSESMDAMGAYINTVKDSEVLRSRGRRDTSSVGRDSVPEGNSEHTVSSGCVDAVETDANTTKNAEVLQSERRRDTSSVGTDGVREGNLQHCLSSECVDTMETDVSSLKDIEVIQSERKRHTPSRPTANVHEGNSEHYATSECMHSMETDINTLNDTEVIQSGRTSIETAHVCEEKLVHCASSECVDTMERNFSTVRDTDLVQSERKEGTPSRRTASVPEGNSKQHTTSECVDGTQTVTSTLKGTEVMMQSERKRDSHSVGNAHVTEGNLECDAGLEHVDIMETNTSTVKDAELMQSERRGDKPLIGAACVPEGNLAHCASSECVNAKAMIVSTLKVAELTQLERRRNTNSFGPACVSAGKLAHFASSECVDTMEVNVSAVKDTEVVQSGGRTGGPPKMTASVPEGSLERCVSSEFVDAMETSVSTVKDAEVVPSGRRRGRRSRETASVPEGNFVHCASSECVNTMELNVSTVKDEKVVPSRRRRGRPPRLTVSVPEGNLEPIFVPQYVDTVETNVSTVKLAEVVQSGRKRSTPSRGTASVPKGNFARCTSSECMGTMETNVSTVKITEVVQSGRKRGRLPKVTAIVPEGSLELISVPVCVDTMETNVSTVEDTELMQPVRRRGRPPKVTASVPEGSLELISVPVCVDTMETNVSTVEDTELMQSVSRRGRRPKVTASVPEGNWEHCANSECVDIMECNPSAVIETERRVSGQSGRRRGRLSKVTASVPEGGLEHISVPECVDSMDTDDNILKGTKRHENIQSVRSGRGRGRGRGRGYRGRCRSSFAQHVRRKERELEQSADGDSLLKVKCGKCSEEMEKKFFERHNRMKHCGLGWIEGTDPVDLNDEKLITRILTKVHQTRKWLTCETCGANKRSVVGFISHLQCCQKSFEERQMLKMECEICGRSMLPVSLKVHMSTVHKNPPKVEEIVTLEELEEQSKMKRAAATKAVSRMQEFIGDEDVGEGNEKPSKHFDGLYLKVESHKINNFTRGAWKRSLKQSGRVYCRHIGCNVESKTLEEALEHYLNCPMAPKKGYVCRTCSFHCEEEPEMLSHVTSVHGNSGECSDNSDADSESDLDTGDEEKVAVKKRRTVSSAASRYKAYAKMKIANKMKFLMKESSGPVVGDKPYVPAVKWTLTFHLENYMQSLYPNIHSTPDDWIALTSTAAAQYLPHTEESVQISRLCMKHKVVLHPQKAVKQWKRLKLFEAEVIDGIPMFFAGGPVWAMAWCPVPLQTAIYRTARVNQYLAVSCHSGMEDTYISGQSYSHSGLIQIWDFGHLDNQQPCTTPKLAVGIAHDYGTVWCMEWCPSGCYDTLGEEVPKCRLRRLGLLGAACSDGTVRIFSICFPSQLQDKVCGSVPIFKVEAVRTLVLDDRQTCLLGDSKWQCTRLSWYKGKGHRIIAGSFTNGMVAMWDIATESPLLSKKVGKSRVLYPYHSFQAHIGVVSAIALSPQDDGRYLLTGSFDRTTKYWDLEDTSAPISVSKRGSVTDGVWLTHWVSAVNSFDDSYSLGHANGTLTPVRLFGFGSYPLLAQNSVAWSLSTCDWVNAVAQSTLAGELTVIFSHQLLIAVDTEKGMRDKRMIISYTDIMHLEDQKEEGAEKGDFAEKPNTSQNSVGVGLPNEHDVMNVDDAMHINSGFAEPLNVHVDHPSRDEKSQLSFEDVFPKLGSRDSIPVLQEGNSAGNVDMDAIDNCDVFISGSDNARTEGPNTEFSSVNQSPCESLTVSVKSEIESKESAITGNLTHNPLPDSVTYTDKFNNINVSSRTSDLSKCDLRVTDNADAERSFSRESSVATESMKDNVGCPEKMDQDSDKKKDSTDVQVVSYDQAHKKCGLILCDFPTNNLKHMPHEARLWMRQSDKMRTADVDAYPIGSINRVSWNPNCRSFLWLASGYHCGLVRVPCMQAMYCKPIEDILQHGERKVAAFLNKVSKDLQ